MRYAIYFTPPQGEPLADLAARWLGRDLYEDKAVDQQFSALSSQDDHGDLTAEPRRYGFHATLKAPFRLADKVDASALHTAFDVFADTSAAVAIPSLTLGQLGSFFALVPADWNNDLQDFAARVVRHFEPFRAPLGEADIARRKPDTLTASQRHHLMTWGYPYVFDDFRFHMTLTGPVPAERQVAVKAQLAQAFAGVIDKPLPIAHLALFAEPAPGAPFVLDRIRPLSAIRLGKTA
jgi:putative phosphonate metabolism protein